MVQLGPKSGGASSESGSKPVADNASGRTHHSDCVGDAVCRARSHLRLSVLHPHQPSISKSMSACDWFQRGTRRWRGRTEEVRGTNHRRRRQRRKYQSTKRIDTCLSLQKILTPGHAPPFMLRLLNFSYNVYHARDHETSAVTILRMLAQSRRATCNLYRGFRVG